jgi:hypothetical protein
MKQLLPEEYGMMFGYVQHYAQRNDLECGDIIPTLNWLRINEKPKPFRYRCRKKTCDVCGRLGNTKLLGSRRLQPDANENLREWMDVWNTILGTPKIGRHPAHTRWCLTLTLTGKGTYLRHAPVKVQVAFANNALKTFYEVCKARGWKPAGTSKLETHHKGKWWHTHIHLDWMLEGLYDKHEGNKETMLQDLITTAQACGFGERIGRTLKDGTQVLEAWTNSAEYMGKSAWYLSKNALTDDSNYRTMAELALKGVNPIRFWGDKDKWELINHNPDWKLGCDPELYFEHFVEYEETENSYSFATLPIEKVYPQKDLSTFSDWIS